MRDSDNRGIFRQMYRGYEYDRQSLDVEARP